MTEEIDFDAEDLSQYDTDLAAAHKSHKQYEREQTQYKDNIRLWTVGQKYFRHKLPNFLTWAEKQQIRLLHDKDPIKWNYDRLAESFPASADTVAQLCKSSWQPKDERRIERHDVAARHTWKLFGSNQIADLPPALAEHLRQFSNRSDTTAAPSIRAAITTLRTRLPTPESSEFSNIIMASSIKSQPTVKTSRKQTTEERPARMPDDHESYLLGQIIDKRPTMFRPSVGAEQAWLFAGNSPPQNPSGTGIVGASKDESALNPFKMQKFDAPQSDEDALKRLSVPAIREHIRIPRRLQKEGATYKMGDCYYDDDGEFLYRVPGMSNSN